MSCTQYQFSLTEPITISLQPILLNSLDVEDDANSEEAGPTEPADGSELNGIVVLL